jgi:hypothetical protein
VETTAASTSAYAPQDPEPQDEPGALPLPDRSPRRSRWKFWIALGLVLLAVRLAFPIVLAPMLASRLSRVLGTRVDVRDVSFAPIDAVVTLRGVTVRAPDATGATDATCSGCRSCIAACSCASSCSSRPASSSTG